MSALPPDSIIDLLRHGEAEGGIRLRGLTNDPLSLEGRKQMWRAVGAEWPWSRIITSPLSRCSDFAAEIGRMARASVEVEACLRELDFGDWDGRDIAEVWDENPDLAAAFWRNPFATTPPHGEAPAEMKQRVLQWWTQLLSGLESGAHLLVVTHGGPLRVLIGEVLALPDQALSRIETPHACLSRIRIPAGGWEPSLVFHAAGR